MNDVVEPTRPVARTRRRGWWMAFAVSTVVFVLGIVVGSVLTSAVMRSSSPWRFDAPQFRADRIADRLTVDLGLTEAQSTRIREIFRSQHEQLKRIRKETEPLVREVLDQTHSLVLAELSPEQQQAWEERYERMRKRMRAPGWDRTRGERRNWRHEGETHDPVRLIEKDDGAQPEGAEVAVTDALDE